MDCGQENYGQPSIEVTPEGIQESPSVNLQKEGNGIEFKVLALGNPLGI
jgi:hypothetical protein